MLSKKLNNNNLTHDAFLFSAIVLFSLCVDVELFTDPFDVLRDNLANNGLCVVGSSKSSS